MVSTRHHPREFPEPATPTHRSSPSTSSTAPPTTPPPKTESIISNIVSKSPTKSPGRRKAAPTTSTPSVSAPPKVSSSAGSYVHTPNTAIIIWLLVSLVLVIWDMLYVFLRPHTMPGGDFHSPIWTPYALYGTIDYIYGWPAWNNHVGFTAAQSALNLVESLGYIWYLVVVLRYGGEAAQKFWKGKVQVQGEGTALAVLVCFSAAVMTVSKTVLYWLNEAFSGFENIGHNGWSTLFFLWIIPNGAWLVVPSYIIYVLGEELLGALESSGTKTKIG